MTYTPATTIAGPSAGNPEQIIAWAIKAGAKRPDDVRLYVDEVYRLSAIAHLRAEVCVAQAVHECSDATTGAPFASSWWVTRCNPAGIGITGDPAQNDASRDFGNGTNAARAHVTHLYLYAVGDTVPSGLDPAWDPRWAAAIAGGRAGCAPTIQGLQNTWGMDNNYANALLGRLNALSTVMGIAPVSSGPNGDISVTSTGDKPMTSSTNIPGLPGGPLVTDYPITLHLFPASNTYQRPGIKAASPRRSIQHETDNPNSTAADEARFFVDDQGGGNQESVHYIVDETGAYVLVPLDEVTWQAADGAGPGNMCGYSCELTVRTALLNDPVKAARSRSIAADLMGRTAARLHVAIPEQHYTFNAGDPNRHDCPYNLRHGIGLWAAYTAQWNASKADELVKMGQPASPPPSSVPWVTPQPIKGLPAYTDYQNDTAKALITEEGVDFVFVGDVVEATEDIPRRQWASYDKSAEINVPIKQGERFIVTFLFKSKAMGDYWYVTPAWSRVPVAKTTRVADAPLT